MKSLNISVVLIVSCFVRAASADVTRESLRAEDSNIQVVRMTVSPAPAPTPALRYRLVARNIDLKDGNAAPYYYRALRELGGTMKAIRVKFDIDSEIDHLCRVSGDPTPLVNLPIERARKASDEFNRIYSGSFRNALEESLRHRECRWELGVENLRGLATIAFDLREFENSREIARLFELQSQLALAEHRYDDAVESIRHQFRLGNDVAKEPFVVCGLIGGAIDEIATRGLTELIASRESPNMYWAIAELPRPTVDLRPAVRFEVSFGPRVFPLIDHAETTERTPQDWNRLFVKTLGDFKQLNGAHDADQLIEWLADGNSSDPRVDARTAVVATGLALSGYSRAKEWLVDHGMERERVEQMAVGQVIAIYSEQIYRRCADDVEKSMYVPYPNWKKMQNAVDQQFYEAAAGENREILPIASSLLPAVHAAFGAQMRLDRELAALRVIEALRMHAAATDRQWPESLADISVVPVPHNPATESAFNYRLDGRTAVLELPRSDGCDSDHRRYEIQIAR